MKSIVIAALLGHITAQEELPSDPQDLSFTDSLEDCQRFAAEFDNTCDSGSSPASVAEVPAVTFTCDGVQRCPNGGESDNCTISRRLCVTCRESGGKVLIRAQSNSMPNHCFVSPRQAPSEQDCDYEVQWMTPTSDKRQLIADFENDNKRQLQGAAQMAAAPAMSKIVTTQVELDQLVCNIMRSQDNNIPDDVGFVNHGDEMVLNTSWGVTTTGIQMFNGIGGEGTDPFYPSLYGRVLIKSNAVEEVDYCLIHPQMQGHLHYHVPSTCQGNPNFKFDAPGTDGSGILNGDVLKAVRDGWEGKPYRSVLGLSKDGRPIYSPFYNNGSEYKDCDVDVCNGLYIDGHYSYVSTFFHPYAMGCFGPGNNPAFSQSCSDNPRVCGVQKSASYFKASIASISTALAVYMTL